MRGWCGRDGVAVQRRTEAVLCLGHLNAALMWIERNMVVSWCMKPKEKPAVEAAGDVPR
jgi:hypothetical protein